MASIVVSDYSGIVTKLETLRATVGANWNTVTSYGSGAKPSVSSGTQITAKQVNTLVEAYFDFKEKWIGSVTCSATLGGCSSRESSSCPVTGTCSATAQSCGNSYGSASCSSTTYSCSNSYGSSSCSSTSNSCSNSYGSSSCSSTSNSCSHGGATNSATATCPCTSDSCGSHRIGNVIINASGGGNSVCNSVNSSA